MPAAPRRDLLHCYEVELPDSFAPTPRDGEVEGFALWPLARVAEALRDGGADFKFNVVAVLAALLIRHGLFAGEEAARLRAALPGYIV